MACVCEKITNTRNHNYTHKLLFLAVLHFDVIRLSIGQTSACKKKNYFSIYEVLETSNTHEFSLSIPYILIW